MIEFPVRRSGATSTGASASPASLAPAGPGAVTL